jgi:hypothetical protein
VDGGKIRSKAQRFGALLPGPEVLALHGQRAVQFWLGRIVGQAGFQFGLSLTASARGIQGGCQVAPRDRHAGFELESSAERCDCAVLLVLQHQRACQEQATSNKYLPADFHPA